MGGGVGTAQILKGLRNLNLDLTAIVSMADDGGSTGILRDQYGVLPPGDVRRALVALSRESEVLRKLFNYRFDGGDFADHSFGNLFLSVLEKITGNFATAVGEASKVLNVRGSVIPVTLDNVRLHAKLTDGTLIKGETNIDIPKAGKKRAPIKNIWLSPNARIHTAAKDAIADADFVVIGPGDLYTSIIPNLLVEGVSKAIQKSKAKKIFVCNLMTKFGETDGFLVGDFVREVERYLGADILDYVLFNTKRPSSAVVKKYKREGSEFVEISTLIEKSTAVFEDLLDRGALVRHNPKALAKILLEIAAVK